jgi:hypothetical protein
METATQLETAARVRRRSVPDSWQATARPTITPESGRAGPGKPVALASPAFIRIAFVATG